MVATDLDIEFARRYYHWYWRGSVHKLPFGTALKITRKKPVVQRQRYRAAMRAVYQHFDDFTWHDDLDPSPTICEVCLRKAPTLLVRVDGCGLISRDAPGDLLCGRCHPAVDAKLKMVILESILGPCEESSC